MNDKTLLLLNNIKTQFITSLTACNYSCKYCNGNLQICAAGYRPDHWPTNKPNIQETLQIIMTSCFDLAYIRMHSSDIKDERVLRAEAIHIDPGTKINAQKETSGIVQILPQHNIFICTFTFDGINIVTFHFKCLTLSHL